MPPDSSVEEIQNKKQKLQKWLDQHQYTRRGILMYERIFGDTYVSVGGEHTTRLFTEKLNLRENMKVLDIGCGIGGSGFYMAQRFGADVHGIDLSNNMIEIALENRNKVGPVIKHRVQFYVEDAVSMTYPENFYDVVYSRDTILHIPDKLSLFKLFYKTLKPGGKIFISDYCKGDKELSQQFLKYVAGRDYKLHTVKDYGKLLEQAGFKNVEATDTTNLMLDMLNVEIKKFNNMKDEFVREFDEDGFTYIGQGWMDKIERCSAGDQCWGTFYGVKP